MNQTLFLFCAVYLVYLFLLPTSTSNMFADPDTYWHLAAGDLIRATGTVPTRDPWSFTAGDTHWYNISWAWETAASTLYQHAGWHGVIMFNSAIIAATVAIIFITCLLHSRDGITSFISSMLSAAMIFNCSTRPLQVSTLFIALLFLLLSQVNRRAISMRWLLVIPVMMAAWVNIHGGFITAFLLMGIHGLDALLAKDWQRVSWLLATGVMALCMIPFNPHGIAVLDGVMRTLASDALSIIIEWQPFSFSPSQFQMGAYLAMFLILVMMRDVRSARVDKWIAYCWFALSIQAIRNFTILAVVSPPLLATAMHDILAKQPARPMAAWAQKLCTRCAHIGSSTRYAALMVALTVAITAGMFCPETGRLYGTTDYKPIPDTAEDIRYIEGHYAGKKLLNSYSLGGPLIFFSRGAIPVFIDGREATAYPKSVLHDYLAFHRADKGWTDLLNHYAIDGAMILTSDVMEIDRLTARKGWHMDYRGKMVAVFLRDK